MLFAAGIGIGIMFYGVLEPMNHAITAPLGAHRFGRPGQQRPGHGSDDLSLGIPPLGRLCRCGAVFILLLLQQRPAT